VSELKKIEVLERDAAVDPLEGVFRAAAFGRFDHVHLAL